MNSNSTSGVSLSEVVAARLRLNGAIARTPCTESISLSELTGVRLFCKQEYLQRTGSFKERGARNALAQLSPEQTARGVIAASAGNHALGLAWHGCLLRIPVTVVMPRFAPLVKVARCRRFGATVVLQLPASMSPDQVKGLIADLAAKGAEPAATPVDPPSADPPPLMTGMKLTVRIWEETKKAMRAVPALRQVPQVWVRHVEAEGGTRNDRRRPAHDGQP